jgi:hypothetical protein
MRRLDFIVIGAQKCGTTALFEYLRRHPGIVVPPGKELPFYSDARVLAGGWDAYARRNFGRADPALLWGTVTTHYMYGAPSGGERALSDPEAAAAVVPRRIHEHAPDAKLVALLRDPVDRAFSHYRMQVLRGLERRSFEDAVAGLLEPDQLALARLRPTGRRSYVTNGEYGRILTPYAELFRPADGLLVVFHDDLAQRPLETLGLIFTRIGADAGFVPPNLGRRYRDSGGLQKLAVDPGRVQRQAAGIPPLRLLWHSLPASARVRLLSAVEEAKYRFDLWNRTGAPPEEPGQEPLERLRRHYLADAVALERLLGVEPPWLRRWREAGSAPLPDPIPAA